MSRIPRLVPSIVAVALVAAACGGDDDAAITTDPTTTVAATVETTDPADTTSTTDAPPETTAPETTSPDTTAPETTSPGTTAPATTVAPDPVFGSLLDVAAEAGDFTVLLAAVDAAGLTDDLTTRAFTVLAPTDDAFEALGQDVLDAALADPALAEQLVLDHLLPLPQTVSDLALFRNVIAVGGASWTVAVDGDDLLIGGARVIAPDVEADNGYLHVIDAVLIADDDGE